MTPPPRSRAPRVPPTAVTPDGLRGGDPLVLATLVERRGADVLAYATAVSPPGAGLRTAAAALVEFRLAVPAATDPGFDPAVELLAATRRVAAVRAENPFRPGDHPRPRERTPVCEDAPRLLVAWAAGRLPDADADRLREHVAGCPDCDALHDAFDRAEAAFAGGASPAPAPAEAGALIAAMALATPGDG